MNILVYTSQYRLPHEAYGAPFTEQLVQAMNEQAQVMVVCPTPWYPQAKLFRLRAKWSVLADVPSHCRMDGVEVYYPKYPMIPKLSGGIQPWLQAISSLRLIRALNRHRKVDIINARWIYPDGVTAVWIGQQLRIPVVLTALGCDINLYSGYRIRGAQIRWAMRNADFITAVSRPLAEKVIDLGVDRDLVRCEPNGVDLGRFRAQAGSVAKHSPDRSMHTYMLVVARLSEEKGIDHLIRALSLLNQRGALTFKTFIVGDGPLKAALLDDVHRYALTQYVSFVGAVPHNEVETWMRNAHALCLPSLREGMPNVILEALASGLPVVASRVGGIPDVINATNGVLAEPGSAGDLATALQYVFSREWDAQQIRSSVEHMSWTNAATVQIEIFKNVLVNKVQRGVE